MKSFFSALFAVLLISVLVICCDNPNGSSTDDNSTNDNSPDGNSTESSNAELSGLTVSTGTLSPAFSAGTTAYNVSVPNATSSITITGTTADNHATLSANSGIAQDLNVGTNTITITVTAQDGTTTKKYVVTVTRAQDELAQVNERLANTQWIYNGSEWYYYSDTQKHYYTYTYIVTFNSDGTGTSKQIRKDESYVYNLVTRKWQKRTFNSSPEFGFNYSAISKDKIALNNYSINGPSGSTTVYITQLTSSTFYFASRKHILQ